MALACRADAGTTVSWRVRRSVPHSIDVLRCRGPGPEPNARNVEQ
ncbi:MAG: hypothetical protein V4739_09555 [Pseudomonadota bacterium]